jgi:hypothetical protein
MKSGVVGATAAVALVAAVAGLVFDLRPDLRPDPRADLGAELDVLAVERGVTYGDWLRRRSGSHEQFLRQRAEYLREGGNAAGLKIPGELAYVKVAVRGFKERRVRLRWAIYDAKSARRVLRRAGVEDTRVALQAPLDEFVSELWLGPITGPGRYFVRVEARQDDGTLLAIADSKAFRGLQ